MTNKEWRVSLNFAIERRVRMVESAINVEKSLSFSERAKRAIARPIETKRANAKRTKVQKENKLEKDYNYSEIDVLNTLNGVIASDLCYLSSYESMKEESTKAIIDVARFDALSVLKKLSIVVSGKSANLTNGESLVLTSFLKSFNPCDNGRLMENMKKALLRDLYNIENRVNMDDKESNFSDTLSDGMDIMQECILSILEGVQSAIENGAIDGNILEMKQEKTVQNMKVVIKDKESKAFLKDIETNIQRETFRRARRCVENNQRIDKRNMYIYLDAILEDESGECYTYYNRLAKYIDIETEQEKIDFDELVNVLKFSKQQLEILELRMCGYGAKAIATYKGVKVENVKLQLRRMREKVADAYIKKCSTIGNECIVGAIAQDKLSRDLHRVFHSVLDMVEREEQERESAGCTPIVYGEKWSDELVKRSDVIANMKDALHLHFVPVRKDSNVRLSATVFKNEERAREEKAQVIPKAQRTKTKRSIAHIETSLERKEREYREEQEKKRTKLMEESKREYDRALENVVDVMKFENVYDKEKGTVTIYLNGERYAVGTLRR